MPKNTGLMVWWLIRIGIEVTCRPLTSCSRRDRPQSETLVRKSRKKLVVLSDRCKAFGDAPQQLLRRHRFEPIGRGHIQSARNQTCGNLEISRRVLLANPSQHSRPVLVPVLVARSNEVLAKFGARSAGSARTTDAARSKTATTITICNWHPCAARRCGHCRCNHNEIMMSGSHLLLSVSRRCRRHV